MIKINQKGQIELLLVFLLLIGLFFTFQSSLKKTKVVPQIEKTHPISQKMTLPSEKKSEQKKLSQKEKIKVTKTEKDDSPPERFNPNPKGKLPAQTRKTIISLETNEKAICRYSQISGLSYDSMSNFFSNTNATSHSTEITTLSEGKEYTFYVKCQDNSGNKNSDDFKISFQVKTPEDKTPPERRFLSPSGTLPKETTQVELTVGTNEKAYCYYSTSPGESFWQGEIPFTPNETRTYHSVKIHSLVPGIYDYFVRCCDFQGNCNQTDALIRFGIGLAP